MVTPYTQDGSVDVPGLRSHAAFLLEAGVTGLHPCGTTGEAPLLSVEERELVAETVISAAGGRAPVIIQVGHLHTSEAVRLARHAAAAGATAISVVTPFYYSLPEATLFSYFSAVASAVPSDFPVYLYNIPQNTNNPVTAPLLAKVMKRHANVVGLKHSQNDVAWLAAFQDATDGKARVFIGSDNVVVPGLALGAAGVVSGNANVFPELFVKIYAAASAGDWVLARRLQKQITFLADLLGNGGSLCSFKHAAALRGVAMESRVRAPLAQLDAQAEERVAAALRQAESWGLLG